MESKDFTNIFLIFSALLLMILFSLFVPILGSIILLLLPLPVVTLYVKYDNKITILFIIISAILLALTVSPVMFIVFIFNIGLIGVSMGAAIREGFSAQKIFIITIIATIISLFLSLALGVYSFEIEILTVIEENIFHVLESNQFSSIVEDTLIIEELILEVIDFIALTFPSLFIIMGISVATINYYVGRLFLVELKDKDDSFLQLKKFKLPLKILIIYILSLLTINLAISKNLFVLLNFFLVVEGIAVLYWYLEHKINLSLLALMLVIIFFVPLLNQSLLLLGALDLIFDFRKLKQSPVGS